MDKSPDLKNKVLFLKDSTYSGHFNATLNSMAIRQAQIPIEMNGKIKGYILAAMSSESSNSVLLTLRNIVLISYFMMLLGLYFVSRFIAGRSVFPVKKMTQTVTRITKNNLNKRVELPNNKDELFELTDSFNGLLKRIENAMQREKQFTSDASHELRTPLATLRGTLEVLIRMPRIQNEYEEKISYSLTEIDRLSTMLEQLLKLARLDSENSQQINKTANLFTIIDESLSLLKDQIAAKNLFIDLKFDSEQPHLVPLNYASLIIDNVLSNAVKYSKNKGTIKIRIEADDQLLECSITDEGVGVNDEDLKHIFNHFFRSNALNHKEIKGNGLGLSIAKKSADTIGARLNIDSEINKGTTVKIIFNL